MSIIDPRTWPVVKGGDPLALYPLRPGVSVKLTAAQARQRGYVAAARDDDAGRREPVALTPGAARTPGDGKKRAPAANKKRAPALTPNKDSSPPEDDER